MRFRASLAESSRHLAALAAYALLAVAFTWPLARHFSSMYLGNGDITTGAWNIWYFRHALRFGGNLLWTDYQYWPYGANLLLHHDTLFYDAIGYFLLPRWGMTATYNAISLFSLVLAGWGTLLLCRDNGLSWPASLLAGGLFAFGPGSIRVLEAISCLDYSCLHVLPFFVWTLTRALRTRALRDAALAALCLTWVWLSNYYYFMFCLLLIAFLYFWNERPLSASAQRRASSGPARAALAVLALAAAACAWLAWRSGQRQFHGRGGALELLRYVAPYAGFWGCALAALAVRYKPRLRLKRAAFSWPSLSPYVALISIYAAMNLPFIVCVLHFWRNGDLAAPLSPWRGGGNATEIAWMFLPGYYNPLWGGAVRRLGAWLHLGYVPMGGPAGASYSGSSLGFLPLLAAWWLWRQKPERRQVRLWYAAAAFSFAMTLGPWIKIFGVDTYLPMPFYFAPLLPFFDGMQTGMRFHVFIMLFLCLIFAAAYDRLRGRLPSRERAALLAVTLGLLAFESAARVSMIGLSVPPLYARLRQRPYGALLRIPAGAIFNGLSAEGGMGRAFDPIYQMIHEKPIVGGYLTRVSRLTYDAMRGDPFLTALVAAQAGAAPAAVLSDARASRWLRQSRVRYVLVDPKQPPALLRVVSRWPLRLLDQGGGRKLYEVEPARPLQR
ncbi:MAG: hypothetical protein KGK30_01625 [Elusimicrobia bacterium]|nr:hypothetical protein [Elusimicrobiota bacterium]